MTVAAYIAFGSNIEPKRNVVDALEKLCASVPVNAVSTVYRTKPLDRPGQADFRNGVFSVDSGVPARTLKFEVLRPIEHALGRRRQEDRYAARTIDLDILLFGEELIGDEDLTVPDPDIRTRSFVAVPLLELAPDLVLPDTGERLTKLATAHDRGGLTPDPSLTEELRARLQK